MSALHPALLVCLSSLLLSLVTVQPVSGAVVADGPTDPSFAAFRDLVVDDAHGHVFISHGTQDVSVRDLDGAPVTTLPGTTGSAGMVLAEDGATLYVGLAGSDAVAAVDTATLDVTTIATGADSCPTHLAITAGLVWFGSDCPVGGGAVNALDPVSGTVSARLASAYNPVLAASPALPDTLMVMTRGGSPVTLSRYDVGVDQGGGPLLTHVASVREGSNGRDLAITPDGSRVITASGAPYHHAVFRTSDLSADGAYDADAYPNAVAVRADGMVAGGIEGVYSDDLYLYQPGSRELYRSYELGGQAQTLLPRGLAFGATRLYAVAGGFPDGPYRLHVLTPRRASDLDVVTDRTRYDFGERAKVTVRLPEGAGESVSLQVAGHGRDPEPVRTLTIGEDDSATVTVAVQRRTTFSVTYAGSEDRDAASATATPVTVRAGLEGSLTRYDRISDGVRLYTAGKVIRYTVRVRPDHAGDCVYSRLQFKVRGRWGYDALTGCMRLSRTSRAAASFTGGRKYVGIPMRFRAEWRGDRENASTRSGWSLARYTR